MTFSVTAKATKIKQELRKMKCKKDISLQDLENANPITLLEICGFAVSFTMEMQRWITERGYNLRFLNDSEFILAIYRILRTEFQYFPKISSEKFLLSSQYIETKLDILLALLNFCQQQQQILVPQKLELQPRLRQSPHRSHVKQYISKAEPFYPEPESFRPQTSPHTPSARKSREQKSSYDHISKSRTQNSPLKEEISSPLFKMRTIEEDREYHELKDTIVPQLREQIRHTESRVDNVVEQVSSLESMLHRMFEVVKRLESHITQQTYIPSEQNGAVASDYAEGQQSNDHPSHQTEQVTEEIFEVEPIEDQDDPDHYSQSHTSTSPAYHSRPLSLTAKVQKAFSAYTLPHTSVFPSSETSSEEG